MNAPESEVSDPGSDARKGQVVEFRNATIADAAKLTTLALLSYGQYFDQLTPEAEEKLRAGVSDQSRFEGLLKTSVSFVCQSGEDIIGMAFLVPSGNAWDIFPAEWSYIRMVGVHPGQQGKGIAKELTRLCIEAAKKQGERVIALHTSEMMNAARHVYEGFGFKIVREIEPRFGKRYWLYTMELQGSLK